MVKKQAQYRIQGMNRDVSESVSNADKSEALFKYAYEIKNMRILTNDTNNNSLVLVNEKGTKQFIIDNGQSSLFYLRNSIIIGAVPFNNKIIIFIKGTSYDTIAVLYYDDTTNLQFIESIIYKGNLGFNYQHPIEAITCYENEEIQKVYWTDGFNSPRMINIVNMYQYQNAPNVDSQFDFTPTMHLNENVTITKLHSGGQFFAGTIQYVLTYSNRYAQETNPFYISPLYYNIKNRLGPNSEDLDRGGKVDELCTNAYKIKITNVDNTFDLIHIYSISTTEQNNRIIKRVVSLNTENFTHYIDTGTNGEILDSNEIAFMNEKWSLICQTLNNKDNRLFVGNLETTNPKVSKEIKDAFRNLDYNLNYEWKDDNNPSYRRIRLPITDSDFYPYNTQLDMNSFEIKTFKSNETYRFGVQLQDKTGKWSEAIWVVDKQNPYYPHYISHEETGNSYVDYYYTFAQLLVNSSLVNNAIAEGFVRIRPVVVFPSWTERETACQGLLCPTVYSTGSRMENAPYAQSSWFVRPNASKNILKPLQKTEENVPVGEYSDLDIGSIAEFRHNVAIPANNSRNGELYCNDEVNTLPTPYGNTGNNRRDDTKANHYIDQSLVTLHSPELEFDSNLQAQDLNYLKFRVIGIINWTSSKGDISLQAGSSPNNPIGCHYNTDSSSYTHPSGSTATTGFKHFSALNNNGINPNGYKTLISGPFWFDYVYQANYAAFDFDVGIAGHVVFPFHKDELNNWDWSDPVAISSRNYYQYKRVPLNSKIIYNAKYSIGNNYYEDIMNYNNSYFSINDIKLYNGNTLVLNPPNYSGISDNILYYGSLNRTIEAPTRHKATVNIDHNTSYTKSVVTHPTNSRGEFRYCSNEDIYYDRQSEQYGNYVYAGQLLLTESQFNIQNVNKSCWGYEYFPDNPNTNFGINLEYAYFCQFCISSQAWVKMQYNSTKHAVIVINNIRQWSAEHNRYWYIQMTLPTINGLNTPDGSTDDGWHYGSGTNFYGRTDDSYYYWDSPFWNDSYHALHQEGIMFIQNNKSNWKPKLINAYSNNIPQYSNTECGWSLIGELYRVIDSETRFGGTSESAMESNIWYIAGESQKLSEGNSVTLRWTEGDTYFQRYDHLKTYSPANVQNGIVDVASFMVETRINLDGRCDINRGRNYFGANNTNFNLMNMAYTQDNNLFTSHTVDSNWLDLGKYPNQVAWSIVKNYGEKIDSWCNISLVTTLDFDGDRGVIRKIERFANELFVFQDSGISKINYNQNVQIATSTGTPIQIANSNAIEGKVYLTTSIGTKNKWSIVNTATGIYFIDYNNIGIYKFNGQNLPVSLTDTFGFRSFMIENIKKDLQWNPKDFGHLLPEESGEFVGYYDSVNGDVLYINKNKCIAFNDKLGIFTSFYSYEDTPYLVNIYNYGIMFKNKKVNNIQRVYVWKQHDGEYCNFFGSNQDSYLTLIVNPTSYTDKIFDNVEYRADMFDKNDNNEYIKYLPEETFTHIRVWNEYQDTKEVPLNLLGRINSYGSDVNIPSNLKKKFRTWRVQIPRDFSSKENKRDRIRNPWAYIKLNRTIPKELNNGDYKHSIHDIIVDYFE